MQSLLITGANANIRLKNAQAKAKEVSSQFDIIYIDTEVEKGIAAVRAITSTVSKKPFESTATSVIIQEAQRLTVEAQNALLKTLEEPNEATQIILTSPNSTSLLPTIVSRCLETHLNSENGEVKTAKLDPEEVNLDQLISYWQQRLSEKVSGTETENLSLTTIHRYTKTLIRLKKAEKLSANKKLLALIAYLENPEKVT